jgi:hypothetical protein
MKTVNNKRSPGSNRRQYPRVKPEEVPGLKSIEISQGSEIDIVNISRGGMLLETETRLRPDLKLVIKVMTNKGVLRIDGCILRSSICSLKGGPKYRSAVEFRQPLELLDAAITTKPEIEKVDALPSLEADMERDEETAPAFLTVIASDNEGFYLQENFSLNNW